MRKVQSTSNKAQGRFKILVTRHKEVSRIQNQVSGIMLESAVANCPEECRFCTT